MKWLEMSTENCTVQRTLDVVGEKWTLLIVRDAFNGVRRFDDFRRHVGMSEAVLADRLRKLVAAGILRTVPYREEGSRTRQEYRLTGKGRDLWPVLVALRQWGDTHAPGPDGPTLDIRHSDCGAPVRVVVECARDRAALTLADVTAEPGPGARPLA
ncbi:transcriptional regulator [Streptomyces sp. SID486]|uniref:winged helix-turn-helix transcriptional regulator n=1 Tax=unclassified Streptomyces TaxID=2593676 RepID=UPI00136D4579|nr:MULTISPECIES: helix-turn-helix domain-containing protein [unclassified Streptomyces]MYW45102.1 transcriptional regulator [Streptomyces sp. SID161]MYX96852.1 transcriptional regulator [Streptomyces sp. SID486]